ncbi:hypothetical protein AB0L64_01195 [Kribbella sp. NPDC051936]|uniref:hypothetical protein n=1 Tax=Kribbella sp. NPDC051936 TaxID=3154946 RepID=UPI00342CB2A9
MTRSDPEPEPTAAADAAVEAEAARDSGDSGATRESADEAEPTPDPEKAERTVERLMWSSAWLTVLVGVFLVVGIARSDSDYSAYAWLGAVVAFLGLLALAATYFACARKRITLRTRLRGPIDVFKGSTVVMVIVVICGLLVPTDNTPALAVLLPWAVTYWLYGLEKTEAPTP